MNKTVIAAAQSASALGVVAAAVDISGLGEATLHVNILSIVCSGPNAPGCRLVVEESLDSFATAVPVVVVDITGQSPLAVQRSWRPYEISRAKYGVAGAKMRLRIAEISANTFVSMEAYIESSL
jgi:hypothetical protein